MARPVKGRQVDRLPDYARFCAAGRELEGHRIVMTVEEYETLRLIDYLELTQEACAGRMGVGRGDGSEPLHFGEKKAGPLSGGGGCAGHRGRRVCAPRKRRTGRPTGPSSGRERRLSHEDSGYL